MPKRIGIVDDHPAVAVGVMAMLKPHSDLQVVSAASTVRALLEPQTRPDLVLLDLRLGDNSTPTTNIAALTEAGITVLVFTSGEDASLVREAARAGVSGLLRKSENPATIVRSIESALAGETVAAAEWAAALSEDTPFVDAQLTARESEVLTRYASGQTADQVAAALFVSRDTVLDHLRRIRRRYAAVERPAPTKIDLHRRALEDGMVEPGM